MKQLRHHLPLWGLIAVLFFCLKVTVERAKSRARGQELFKVMEKSACPTACSDAQRLLSQGVDFSVRDKEGETLLMRAIRNTDTRLVEIIEISDASKDGKTELFVATFLQRPATVKKLLEQGISPNVKNRGGETPLFYAALLGDVSMMKLLLNSGADKDVLARNGDTPLDCTQYYGDEGNKVAARLLKTLGAKHGSELKRG